jgi:hypothetical protein
MSEMKERLVATLRAIDFTVGTPNYFQVADALLSAMRDPPDEFFLAWDLDESAGKNWDAVLDEALK